MTQGGDDVAFDKAPARVQDAVDYAPEAKQCSTKGWFGYVVYPGQQIRKVRDKSDTVTVEDINSFGCSPMRGRFSTKGNYGILVLRSEEGFGMGHRRRWLCAVLLVCLTGSAAWAEEDTGVLFQQAAEQLLPPAQVALETRSYSMHPQEVAFVPDVAPLITPYDERETTLYPPVEGTFTSTNEAVVTVDDKGLMTALGEGVATVTYHKNGESIDYSVSVGQEVPTETAKNMAYIARREFYAVKRSRLPKYNQYAKWYYGKKNEVGWCSVFGIWCANAAGANPVKWKSITQVSDQETLYLREGQVGSQYEGFMKWGRFSGVPRLGYMVIYADMSNAYRTTHIGIVVDVQDMEDGIYQVTTVEGNMSNTVKSYCYLYDSNADNHLVGTEKGLKLQWNMSEVPREEQKDPLVQYALHTEYWSVFGFCETWI